MERISNDVMWLQLTVSAFCESLQSLQNDLSAALSDTYAKNLSCYLAFT